MEFRLQPRCDAGRFTLLAMKLTALLILVGCLHVAAKTNSQTVTLSGKNLKLEKVLSAIKKQTGFRALYDDEVLQLANPVTVNATDESLSDFLSKIFAQQPLAYSVKNTSIIISRKEVKTLTPSIETILNGPPITVRGRVINEKGEPVIASVTIKGRTEGVITDNYGNFELDNINENAVLIISGISIQTQEIRVNGKSEIIINVQTKIDAEEEITINGGYYTTTDKTRTGNIGKITAKDIGKQPVTSPLMALQGRVAGVNVTPVSGSAGSAPTIQIRGMNSLQLPSASGPGGNLPLYVVDGVQIDPRPLRTANFSLYSAGLDPLMMLNPSNIESIEILKDADATAIYGSRGANGVVLITTKSAKPGKAKLDINFYTGGARLIQRAKMLNTEQYIAMREEAFANDNAVPRADYDYDINGTWDKTRYTDWQKELLGGTANILDGQVFLSGGDSKTSYRLGGSYHKEGTIYPGDFKFETLTASFNLNHTSADKKFWLVFSTLYGANMNHQFNGSLFSTALGMAPNAPEPFNPDGTLNWEIVTDNSGTKATWRNPYATLRNTHDINATNLQLNTSIGYKIASYLSVKADLGLTNLQQTELMKEPMSARNPLESNTKGIATFGNNARKTWMIEPKVEYDRSFQLHHLSVIAGTTLQNSIYEYRSVKGDGYESDAQLNSLRFAQTQSYLADGNSQYRYGSVYARIGYDYNQKYIFSLTGRRDGSSRFGPGYQYGNFGSVAGAWIFSQESFLSNSDVLSFGKIRASYGITGNDQIGDYSYLDTYVPEVDRYQNVIALNPERLANRNYRWEQTNKFEIAAQLGFFRDRVNVDISVYKNRSTNQLVEYAVPITTGFESYLANFPAKVENKGIEISINARIINKKDFSWRSYGNLTVPRTKLLEFKDIEKSSYLHKLKIGEQLELSERYAFKEVDPQTGKPVFFDMNNDDLITTADLVLTKTPYKKWYLGWGNDISIKKLEISFLFQYASDISINNFRSIAGGVNQNYPVSILGRWRKAGDVTDIPAFSQSSAQVDNFLLTASNYNIVNGSFLRLKNLSISYDLSGLGKTLKVNSARLFIMGQNLFTISPFNDAADPEVYLANASPQLFTLTAGIQLKL